MRITVRNNEQDARYGNFTQAVNSCYKTFIAVALLATLPAKAAADVRYEIYLTNHVISTQPTSTAVTQFDCSDRIFVVVEATGLAQAEHELTVEWINPADERLELTNFDFHAHPSTPSRVWAWLQLHGPTGAVIGQIFDPSFGMEDFIGEWHARVLIDQEQIGAPVFNVLC